MRLACLPAAKRLFVSLATAATTAALLAIAPAARAADKQINAVPRALALAPALSGGEARESTGSGDTVRAAGCGFR